MKQELLYKPVKEWLESQGFKSLIIGTKPNIVVPIGDLLPGKAYLVPDIVGVKVNQVAIVEVEMSLDKIVEVIGKCMVWKACATLVYVACPLEECQKSRILERLGIGLLGVSNKGIKEVVKIMPENSYDLRKVLELHPLDLLKEMELARLIKSMVEADGVDKI